MSGAPVRVRPLRCGSLRAAGEAFVAGWTGSIDLQVWAFLIEHPSGTVLFDAGMHPVLRDDAEAHLGPMARAFGISYEADDDVASRVAACDVDPASIDRVVCSHLHFDHAGGCGLLPSARLVVQRREWDHAPAGGGGYVEADWATGQDAELIDGEHDLFGDGLVRCVPTFGHTPGHQSLLVRTGDRELLLTADACYLRASLERMALPAFGWDLEAQRQVLRRFAAMEAAGTVLVFGHDPVLPAAAGVLER